MLNTFLFIHLVVALLLIATILLQKTSADGLSGIGGGNNMSGIMTGRAAANFLTKTTIMLAVIFFTNSMILANLSTKKHTDIATKLNQEKTTNPENVADETIPIAK